MNTYGAGEPERHTYCPDEDHRCQHGDDMNCPDLGPCKLCNGKGIVLVRAAGTHDPNFGDVTRWKCNCDGTLTAPRCAQLGHVWVGVGDEGRVVCDDCDIDKPAA